MVPAKGGTAPGHDERMAMFRPKDSTQAYKYPGIRMAMDGNTAVIMCEREASDAAGAYPITPSTQMGEYWAEETAKGHINVSGKPAAITSTTIWMGR